MLRASTRCHSNVKPLSKATVLQLNTDSAQSKQNTLDQFRAQIECCRGTGRNSRYRTETSFYEALHEALRERAKFFAKATSMCCNHWQQNIETRKRVVNWQMVPSGKYICAWVCAVMLNKIPEDQCNVGINKGNGSEIDLFFGERCSVSGR